MTWKAFVAVGVPALLLTVVAAAQNEKPESKMAEMRLKAVVHINFDDEERQEHGLGNIENILKGVSDAQIEVVCHGPGIGLLQHKKSSHADKVRMLIEGGVEFAACENTMQKKSISKSDLITGVKAVPSGAVEILRKQQNGYAYFRP